VRHSVPSRFNWSLQAMDITPLFTKLVYMKYDCYVKLNSRTGFPPELNSP